MVIMNNLTTQILDAKWMVKRHVGSQLRYYIKTVTPLNSFVIDANPFLSRDVAEEIVTSHNALVDLRAGNLPGVKS